MPRPPLSIGPVAALLLVLAAPVARAQDADSATLARTRLVLSTPTEERVRLEQVMDGAATSGWLLRAPSSISRRSRGLAILPAHLLLSRQSGSALSDDNDGPLWQGLGWNTRLVAGFRADLWHVHAIVAPELLYAENRYYHLANPVWPFPGDPGRSPFASPWYIGTYSADLPLRMGDRPIRRLDPGQSSFFVDAGPVDVGIASENEWWGPGVRNAIVLSSAAAGFPHVFVRTGRPVKTGIGDFEGRLLTGILRESPYFDYWQADDWRSISMAAVTWRPIWEPGLTVGASRAVFAQTRNFYRALRDWREVFADVGQPNNKPDTDYTIRPGRDQIFSLFGRWVFPADGFETWAEWGRTEQPTSLRDFLLAPNHSQGYTLGLQWVSPRPLPGGRPRVLTEFTYLEQSPTYRDRHDEWFYASRAVLAGYTERGQPLGATIGPGASSQYLELGWVTDRLTAGLSLSRVRWNDDAYENGAPVVSYCHHDVSALVGARASWTSELGTVGMVYGGGPRMNPFFRFTTENCNIVTPYDERVTQLRLTFTRALP